MPPGVPDWVPVLVLLVLVLLELESSLASAPIMQQTSSSRSRKMTSPTYLPVLPFVPLPPRFGSRPNPVAILGHWMGALYVQFTSSGDNSRERTDLAWAKSVTSTVSPAAHFQYTSPKT